MNKVILMGRLTRDPEVRQTASGVSSTSFSIAVNRKFKNANGEYEADFINCVAWRESGERIAKFFRKGSMIAIVGSIQTRSWEGQDGKRQYATEVIVDEWDFTGSKAESGTEGSNGQQTSQSAQQEAPTIEGDTDDLPF